MSASNTAEVPDGQSVTEAKTIHQQRTARPRTRSASVGIKNVKTKKDVDSALDSPVAVETEPAAAVSQQNKKQNRSSAVPAKVW